MRRPMSRVSLIAASVLWLLTVVLGIALTGFQGMSDTSDGAALMADTNLNLRNALNVMTRDLLSAGRNIPVGGIAIPSGDAADIVRPSPNICSRRLARYKPTASGMVPTRTRA